MSAVTTLHPLCLFLFVHYRVNSFVILSCSAPRAFEISNFLSQTEVDHIMYLTTGMKLHRSTTAGDSGPDPDRDHSSETRTSLNTWVYREKDTIIDSIYRRAADLLRIDEALLRPRSADEHAHLSSTRSLAEALQLVHYDPGQVTIRFAYVHTNTMPHHFIDDTIYYPFFIE